MDTLSFQHLFEMAPLSSIILSTDFKILAVTNRYLADTLTKRELIVGKCMFDVFPDDPSNPNATGVFNLKASLNRVLITKKPDRMATQKYDVLRRDGSGFEEKYWEPINIPVLNDKNEILYIIHRAEDVTERVRRSCELSDSRHSVDILEEEKSLRETFVATLSHDLKQPLTAIQTAVQLLERTVDAAKRSSLTAKIVDNVRRTEKMITNLLDANRIHVGEPLTLTIEECQLANIVNTVLDELTIIHGDRFRFSHDGSIKGYWSSEGLRRILENLCSNAVKYGDASEIDIRIKATEDRLTLSVHNFGNPLDREQIENIFHQFYRGKDSKKKIKGWGLGLTLVKGLAEAQGGYVTVESAPEKGTTFNIVLPLDSRDFQKGRSQKLDDLRTHVSAEEQVSQSL